MRLKALSLSGFKSFADKTTLEFPAGVTCIVGPNGCGKSNVVDAAKWVLGEQSARSLRGEEMLDVVFNGTAQRRSAGFAEVTLVFEDAAGVLRQQAEGGQDHIVSVSRRLYRNGESQYLINDTVARLKDIREMFLDTGVGTDAYSLIEQGKVETFLQGSMEERRSVFDEAAGISRYKVRRHEATRRLERVEQNLLRLTDVLAEVRKRLRSIKYQAGKARSYQQYSARLKELRSLYALAEYDRLGRQRRELQGQADARTDGLARLAAQIDRLEASGTACETELSDLEKKAHDLDGRMSELSARLVASGQRAEMLSARAAELGDAIAADASQCEQVEARVEANRQELQARRRGLEELAARLAGLLQQEDSLRRQQAEGQRTLQRLSEQLEDEKNGTIDLLRRTAQLHNEINTHNLRRESLHVQRQRLTGQAEEMSRTLEALLARRAEVQTKLEDVQAVLADSQARLEQAHQQARQLDQDAADLNGKLSQAQQRHSALLSRQAVLEEMQRRLEGVGEGVRRLLAAAGEGRAGFLRGMLGDFLETDVSSAAAVEAALGPAEQWLVVERLEDALGASGRLAELLGDAGGVELLCLDRLVRFAGDRGAWDLPSPADPAIIARAADRVRCDGWLAPAVEMLLGRTLIVGTLQDACRLSDSLAVPWRFVTPGGEVLEPDGRVRIGSGKTAMGVVWRKSELADLARRLPECHAHLAELAGRIDQVRAQRAHVEEVIHSLRTAVYEAQTERVECQTLGEQFDRQVDQIQRTQPLLAEEVRQLAAEIESAVRQEHQAQEKAAELEALRAERQAQIAVLTAELDRARAGQEDLSAQLTAAQVALAEARQKQSGLEEVAQGLDRAGQALGAELEGLRARMEQSRQRKAEAEAGASQARKEIESLLIEKAAVANEVRENQQSRAGLQQRLADIRQQLEDQRRRREELVEELNALRVQLGQVEAHIQDLVARTQEEMGMDLPAAHAAGQQQALAEGKSPQTLYQDRDWQAVQQEIADLRGRIERLGNVNLDAIAEQDELQQREKFLGDQTEDVRSSQRQLNDLIRRINAESRQRFEESFQAVRGNFNELFRKLFGGGKADVILTVPEDVLESPIEVVARPPGKELRSITLMSGGEKTMTALALLFSFFKARPSPFCLLDEVDAALDETNTERFVQLVREFLPASQFVIISHCKRTIAMADQIYGITMQEPGVSTKISVRFEEATRLVEQSQPQIVSA